jgi:hypothetical protein
MAQDNWTQGDQAALKPPFPVPVVSDTVIQNRGAVATSSGDLRFGFEVARVVAYHPTLETHTSTGELNAMVVGSMTEKAQLSKILKLKLYLHFNSTNPMDRGKAFTISVSTFNGYNINRRFIGNIGAWRRIELEAPIEWLRSPKYYFGTPVTPVINELIVKTNMDSQMEIDPQTGKYGDAEGDLRGYLGFGAMAPVIFVHGTNADKTSWEPGVTSIYPEDSVVGYLSIGLTYSNPNFVPWEYRINLSKEGDSSIPVENQHGNGGIDCDAWQLSTFGSKIDTKNMFGYGIPNILSWMGAEFCHLVGHSKGGMAIRQLVHTYHDSMVFNVDYSDGSQEFKHINVLSLWTIDTPHKGTILSDIAFQSRSIRYWSAELTVNNHGWIDPEKVMRNSMLGSQTYFAPALPTGDALLDQLTARGSRRDARLHLPTETELYYVAADAEDGIEAGGLDSGMRWEEVRGLVDTKVVYWIIQATSIYRTLGYVRRVNITSHKEVGCMVCLDDTYIDIDPSGYGDNIFIGNDLVTTVTSAQPKDGLFLSVAPFEPRTNHFMLGNHSSVKNGAFLDAMFARILARPLRYDVNMIFKKWN